MESTAGTTDVTRLWLQYTEVVGRQDPPLRWQVKCTVCNTAHASSSHTHGGPAPLVAESDGIQASLAPTSEMLVHCNARKPHEETLTIDAGRFLCFQVSELAPVSSPAAGVSNGTLAGTAIPTRRQAIPTLRHHLLERIALHLLCFGWARTVVVL